MKSKNVLLLILFLITIFSCRKIIDYKIPDSGRKLVVNSFFNSEDTIKINLSKSLHILDDAEYEFINDAVVSIYEDDQFVENLTFTSNGNYTSNYFIPSQGKNYKIVAWNDDFDEVSAIDYVPNSVLINSVDTATTTFVSQNGTLNNTIEENVYEFNINFDDPSGDNYYMIKMQYIYKYQYEGETFTYLYDIYDLKYNDVIIEKFLSNQGAVIFSDDLFEGENLNLSLFVSKYNFYTLQTPVIISLYSISEAFYKYSISLDEQQNVAGNPFAEPVQVYNNVTDGYGIFAGYSVEKFTVFVDGEETYYIE
ncbi:MAG TPA: hypothetical protein DDX39_10950 [Bacteroidales bacterium]|nr:MAG: hypothetical protein A2W98_11100 [Bacteroidetes bacterium GWF2_33_38]HBF89149.1 hypothetical protein [Bacteroidales bacterium]